MKRAALPILLGCFAVFSCARKESGFMTDVIDGVRVVRNLPVKVERKIPSVTFVEELSLGGTEDAGGGLFFAPNDIDADQAGNIYVLDGRDAVIRKFDARGTLLRTIGRKGQGPGEFERPTCLEIFPDGRILVADPYRMRLFILTSDDEQTDSILMKNYVSEFTIGPDGRVVAGYGDFDQSAFRTGMFNLETGMITPVISQAIYWPARIMDNQLRYDLPYFVRWDLDSGNRLIAGSAVAYEISVFDETGRLEFKFKKDHSRIPVQGDMLAKVSAMASQPSSFQKQPNPYLKNPYYPVFESLAIDEGDRIWIQGYQPKWTDRTNRDTPYDVFSPQGVFLFEARIPGHVTSKLVFKNGFIYALKKTEAGFPQAVRLRIDESNLSR